MGNFDLDPSASRYSPAFKRLASKRAGGASVDPPSKRSPNGSLGSSIFNQVQLSTSSQCRAGCEGPSLSGLQEAVDDNKASALTLHSLTEASREVREANLGASAVSVKEVEAAARLAEDLGRRIVNNDQAATEAHADKLSVATVERFLRS